MGLDTYASRSHDDMDRDPVSEADVRGLRRFVGICAARGLGRIGWS